MSKRKQSQGSKSDRQSDSASPPPLAIEFEGSGGAIYVRLSDEPVSRTVEVDDEILADYDANDGIVGFEIIGTEHGRSGHVLGRLRREFADKAPALALMDALSA